MGDRDDRRPPARRDSRSRNPPRRRSPPRQRRDSRKRSPPRRERGNDEEIMTLFVRDLPEDAREGEVAEDLEKSGKVLRVMLLKKDGACNAFVRFDSVKNAERAMDDVQDGARVCGKKVRV